ncbi:MAG: hypothetical protein J0H69_00050 [Burkholderiales bacterium]|nr:hypothetical protein [Burkholderiales bacterium]
MLKGLALTPPVVGRISIGRIVEKNGKRLPVKDDEFTLTTQVQTREGWLLHPLDEQLRKTQAQARTEGADTSAKESTKLRRIPIRLLFGDPELNLRASYCLFDRTSGRPICVGNGETCRRSTPQGVQSQPCPAPEACELAEQGCKPFGRLNVRIGEEDDLSTFVFRTTGFNSIRTLATRLKYFQAVSGGNLATLPLELRLRGKSTQMSHGTPIYYVDITVPTGSTLAQGIGKAQQEAQTRREAGFSQESLDQAAREGLAQGAFEETPEDGGAVVEEFYPPQVAGDRETPAGEDAPPSTLREKLDRKAKARNEAV